MDDRNDGVPGLALHDPVWLAERVTDTSRRWGCDDARVAGTLWWYSASVVLTREALRMLLVEGTAPAPDPRRMTLRLTEYGYLRSVHYDGPPCDADAYAAALPGALDGVVAGLARVSGARERALWAIASDSVAGQTMRAGREEGRVVEAGALVRRLARPPLLPGRFVDIVPGADPAAGSRSEVSVRAADPSCSPPEHAHRLLRRSSCCLIYQARGERKCVSCPRRHPDDRAEALRRWLDRQ